MNPASNIKDLAGRMAAMIPSTEPEPFSERGKQLVCRFITDVTERPERFPKTIAFMRAMTSRKRGMEDDLELSRMYAEEAGLQQHNN